MTDTKDIVWTSPDGKPIACVEKIKVMNQNFQELGEMVVELLEDGLLMGCDEDQIRQALHLVVAQATTSLKPR